MMLQRAYRCGLPGATALTRAMLRLSTDAMLRALALSIAQLGDPPILRILVRSLAVTLSLLVLVAAAIIWGARSALVEGLALDERWGTLGAALAGVAAVLGGWLVFRTLAIAVVGLFADGVVEAVEARHFPQHRDRAMPLGVARSLRMASGSVARAVLVNAALLPAYLLLLATGIGSAALFFIANSWLLGRDLGDMVAARHMDDSAMRTWRRQTWGARMVLGGIGTAILIVPVAGLLGPILGAAMATHLFHTRTPR